MTTPLSMRDVVHAGLNAVPPSAWHQEHPDNWHWHASELGHCPRQLVYKRAQLANDPPSDRSSLVLTLGTMWHVQFEHWLKDYAALNPGMDILTQEVGYYHDTLKLAAKPDALVRVNDTVVLLDYKTEHEDAVKRRKEEAVAQNRSTAAKPEHVLQLTATAMVLEANGFTIDEGRVWYMSKGQGWTDEQPVNLHDATTRQEVITTIARLESAWEMFQSNGLLPQRLDQKNPRVSWACRPQKGSTAGEYCRARSICMHPNSAE